MTVKLKASDKQLTKETKMKDEELDRSFTLYCSMHNFSYIAGDELVEEWAPEWCAESIEIDNPEDGLPIEWVKRGKYILCPGCEEHYQAKFAKEGVSLKDLMEGNI